jgi:hypothetical protein
MTCRTAPSRHASRRGSNGKEDTHAQHGPPAPAGDAVLARAAGRWSSPVRSLDPFRLLGNLQRFTMEFAKPPPLGCACGDGTCRGGRGATPSPASPCSSSRFHQAGPTRVVDRQIENRLLDLGVCSCACGCGCGCGWCRRCRRRRPCGQVRSPPWLRAGFVGSRGGLPASVTRETFEAGECETASALQRYAWSGWPVSRAGWRRRRRPDQSAAGRLPRGWWGSRKSPSHGRGTDAARRNVEGELTVARSAGVALGGVPRLVALISRRPAGRPARLLALYYHVERRRRPRCGGCARQG